jgi:hypothetical protein
MATTYNSPIFTSPQQLELEEMERRGMRRQSSFYGIFLFHTPLSLSRSLALSSSSSRGWFG